MPRAELERAIHGLLDGMIGRLEAEHQHGARAVPCRGEPRLALVEQAAVGWVESGLRDLPHALGAQLEASEADAGRAPVLGSRLNAHPRLGDDAERSLRAGEHPVGAHAGARTREPARLPDTRRREGAHGLEEILDMRPDRGEVAGRPRRDPSSERRELERLREVAQREPVLVELALERRARSAGLDARGTGDPIDLEHAIERAEIDRYSALVGGPDERR